MQLRNILKNAPAFNNTGQTVTGGPAVGKDKNFAIIPGMVEIVEQGRDIRIFLPQMNQAGNYFPAHMSNDGSCIVPKVEKSHYFIHPGNGGGHGDFLNRFSGFTFQSGEQVHQVTAPVLMQQRMHLIHNHNAHPEQKCFKICIGGSQHHIQGFRGGEHNVRTFPPGAFDIPGADGKIKTQPFGDHRFKSPF